MNRDLVNRLSELATAYSRDCYGDGLSFVDAYNDAYNRKFAELIVQECVAQISKNPDACERIEQHWNIL
jgi:uncharacterized protein (UPF0276 family)